MIVQASPANKHCLIRGASGNLVSTLSNTSENKPEGVNLPATAEGEPSSAAESGSPAATNSTQIKAMNANETNPVSSGQAEEDAQGNSCVQTVQPSVELNVCAVSTHSMNPDAAAEAPASAEADNNNPNTITTMSTDNDTPATGSVSDVNAADVTNITPENAVALASANLNSGTDCATTTTNNTNNTNITMNNHTTTTAGALASEGVSPDFDFTESKTSPVEFNRVPYTAPDKPGNDWDLVYSGVCMDGMGQNAVTNELVLMYDKLELSRPTQLAVYMTVDDHGDLLISNSELADDAIQAAFDNAPKISDDEADVDTFAGSVCLHMDLQGTEWQDFDNGAAAWKRPVRTLTLPQGDYFIYGRVTNDPMNGGNANNRKLFRYAIYAKHDIVDDDGRPVEVQYHGGVAQVCNTCGCSNTDDGDADNQASAIAPGWEGDACPSVVRLNPETGKALYDSPWRWKVAIDAEDVVITPPTGDPLLFSIPAADSSEAGTAGASAMAQNRVQYQDSSFNATTSRTPAFIMMKDPTGLCLTFSVSTGEVYSITSPEGRKVTATERAQHVETQFDGAGNLLYCASAESKLVCSTDESGQLLLKWFPPDADVETDTPFKTETIQRSGNDTTLTRQQTGRDPHSLVRSENNGVVTITKGEGDDAIVHRYETTYPMNGLMVRTESVYYASTPDNVAFCTRSVYNYSEAGWQLYSRTEGYGSDAARCTSYFYGLDNRLSRISRPDGSYTEFAYDSLGRVVMEKSPWGAGLAKITRTTYADSRFFDNRPASVAEYHVNASGTELLFRTTTYAYEETSAMERTTTTVIAAGSNLQQQSIEETFGEQPAYAFAAGKPKFSQGIDGVQTWHDYEATTQHGAVHRHTSITKANGALVAAQSRKTESFLAANGTTTFTQESIWNGSEWLLLDTTAYEYDEQQRVVKTTRGNGRFSTTAWMCCGQLRETDEDGITTTYAYNSAHQLTETSREAVYDGDTCITPETITEFVRDAAGRVISTTRRIGSMASLESTVYDALGRVTTQVDVLGRSTTTAYSEDGLTTTRTTPAGATFVTTRNADGSTASVGGTGQREQLYVYDLSGNNERVSTKLPGGAILSQSITNGFGQSIVQVQANSIGGYIYSRSEYNAKGQMVKSYQDTGWNTPATAATLFEYDSFGNQVKQVLALSSAPTKDNSPVSEVAYAVESAEDGVYAVTTQTHYNAAGQPLATTQKQLISRLSGTLSSKNISIDVRGNSSVSWSEYSAPAKVTSFSTIPTSNITAESISIDGFTLSQKDHAGIITTASRSYTATGMTLVQVDGRGNATTSITDIAGRTISVTDAAGAVTTTAYDALHDLPAEVTDALGNTSCYKYDALGRKIAEWGTALQPACFGYDIMGNMTSLRTFRAESELISIDPSERTDGDVTTWTFNAVTGLEISKTYADNSSVVKTYDAYNRPATETDARGNVKMHSYEHARGLLLSITYSTVEGSAATNARSYTYNHLGQMTQLVDDAGTRSFSYNAYGEQEGDSLAVDGDTHLVTETRDSFGRSTGYVYSKNGSVQQSVTTGYGTDGRIASASFLHGGVAKQFGYQYLAGSNLLHMLIKPNNMTLTQTYETNRDLLTGMAYHRGTTLVAQRQYSYDVLGRPTARNTARQGTTVNDTFAHNTRSELVEATVSGKNYEYAYDNIGNREFSLEDSKATMYDANSLNQYTSIAENGGIPFIPQFDADGNQTLIKTETGIWSAVYNAENRPVTFTNTESNTVVECQYDSMGRRAYKKVTVNGSVTLHQRYIYRDYLQIACIDLTRSHHPALWYITWDATQPVATRPLAVQINGTWYTYGWDLTKNICELYSSSGTISTSYTYAPFGQVTASGAITQPIQWSSEVWDSELGLVYYNWRYYNVQVGKWINRDSMLPWYSNLYTYADNIFYYDYLGAEIKIITLQRNVSYKDNKNVIGYTKAREGYNYLNFVSNATIIAKKKDDCYVGEITDVPEPNIIVTTYMPQAGPRITNGYYYTEHAIDIIRRHEAKRLEVYREANREYLSKVVPKTKLISGSGYTQEEAIFKTRDYLKQYWDDVKSQFIDYVYKENSNITKEYDIANYEYAKYDKKAEKKKLKSKYRSKKKAGTIIGFKLVYRINVPPDIVEPIYYNDCGLEEVFEAPPLTPPIDNN